MAAAQRDPGQVQKRVQTALELKKQFENAKDDPDSDEFLPCGDENDT